MRLKQPEAKPQHPEGAGHQPFSPITPAQQSSTTTKVQTNSSVQLLDSYESLLSLPASSAAAQTIVTTTTTKTTTTQFNPFAFGFAQGSNRRKSKQFPIANEPIPIEFEGFFGPPEEQILSETSGSRLISTEVSTLNTQLFGLYLFRILTLPYLEIWRSQ